MLSQMWPRACLALLVSAVAVSAYNPYAQYYGSNSYAPQQNPYGNSYGNSYGNTQSSYGNTQYNGQSNAYANTQTNSNPYQQQTQNKPWSQTQQNTQTQTQGSPAGNRPSIAATANTQTNTQAGLGAANNNGQSVTKHREGSPDYEQTATVTSKASELFENAVLGPSKWDFAVTLDDKVAIFTLLVNKKGERFTFVVGDVDKDLVKVEDDKDDVKVKIEDEEKDGVVIIFDGQSGTADLRSYGKTDSKTVTIQAVEWKVSAAPKAASAAAPLSGNNNNAAGSGGAFGSNNNNNAAPSSSASSAGETGDMVGFTDAHNKLRAQTPGVGQLKWSNEVAASAAKWAANLKARKNCQMQHSSREQRNGYGENLAWAMGMKMTPQQVTQNWFDEIADYNYAANSCKPGKMCGHYTQVVWKQTKEVGCAKETCGNSEIWVCQYNPPGNYVGRKPY